MKKKPKITQNEDGSTHIEIPIKPMMGYRIEKRSQTFDSSPKRERTRERQKNKLKEDFNNDNL